MNKAKKNKKSSRASAPNKNKILNNVKPSSRKVKGRGGFFEDAGAWLGKKAGGLLASVTGFGDYDVKSNSLVNSPNGPPIFTNTTMATRIQHREFIGDIVGSTDFIIRRYPINPGLPSTFPWLAGVADSFETYELKGCIFEFKTTSAVALNSSNTALGTVIMATEYNSNMPNFTAKRDMENHVYSGSAPPCTSLMHPIECSPFVNVLSNMYVRSTPTPDSDLRMSDIGAFQLATVGMQASAVIGELWVTYDIVLTKPKLPAAYSTTPPAHYQYLTGSGTSPSAANIFGALTAPKYKLHGVGVSPVKLDTNKILFKNSGSYLVVLSFASTGYEVSNEAPDLVGTCIGIGDIVLDKILLTGPGSVESGLQAPLPGANGTHTIHMIVVTVGEVKPGVETGLSYLTTNLLGNNITVGSDLFITTLPPGFTLADDTISLYEMQTQMYLMDKTLSDIKKMYEITQSDDSITIIGPKCNDSVAPPNTPVRQQQITQRTHRRFFA